MPFPPVQSPKVPPKVPASQFALAGLASVPSSSAWRPLSDIVSGIVHQVQVQSPAATDRESDLPKAA
jgi:hypothetical protein